VQRRKGALGQGKTWPKAGVLVPGEWQERWVSSTRNRLQLKESRKDDAAAVKWPRWLPCLHAPEKVLSLGPAVAFALNSQLPPDTAKHFPNCGQERNTFV
jgi:hypothetical protein